jgi:hypothetical protein
MERSDIAEKTAEVRDILDLVEKRHGREQPPEDVEQDLQRLEISQEKIESIKADLQPEELEA